MDFTASLKQSAIGVTATTTTATFTVRSGWVYGEIRMVAGAGGTLGAEVVITPVGLPAPRYTTIRASGKFRYSRVATNEMVGSVYFDGTDLHFIQYGGGLLGVSPSFAVASTDILSASFRYIA